MPVYKVPDVHSAIIGSHIFQMPFSPNSYADIFSCFGFALEIGRVYIDKITAHDNRADLAQAVIDEVVQTLSARFAGINLPWMDDQNEVPFWRAVVESGRQQLELYAEYTAPKNAGLVYEVPPGTPPPMVDEEPDASNPPAGSVHPDGSSCC